MEFKVNVKVTEVYTKSFIVNARSKKEAESKLEEKWNEELYDATTDCVEEQNVEYSCTGKATKQDVIECDSLDDYIDEDEDEDEDQEDTDDEEILEAVNQYGVNIPNKEDTVILYIAPMDIMNFKEPESFMFENFCYSGFFQNVYDKKHEIKKAAIVAIKAVKDELIFVLSDGEDQYDETVSEISNPADTLFNIKELVTEGLNSDDRDWLVLYNSVYKYGAPQGVDIWRHYDGVYLPGAEGIWSHDDIPDNEETKQKILNALRAGETPEDSIQLVIH